MIEFTRVGPYLRCAAVHAATGIEAVASGPVGAGQAALQALAIGKLKRALAARRSGA